jgi:hypothetical protein
MSTTTTADNQTPTISVPARSTTKQDRRISPPPQSGVARCAMAESLRLDLNSMGPFGIAP